MFVCYCLFFATGAGVGVYFYLRDDHVTTTTTSTPWATSTATRTPSFEVTVVPDITTQANVIVETSQALTETTTTVVTAEQATSVQQDISAIQQDIEVNVLCRGVKFIELPITDSRNLALGWLQFVDLMQADVSYPNLHQRYALAQLAFGTNDVSLLTATDECDWFGVTCNGYGKVSKVELGKFLYNLMF